MNWKILIAGAVIAAGAAGVGSFRYHKFTGWNDERVDPYTLKAICRETTYVSLFGKMSVNEGPNLPDSECRNSTNLWFTEPLNEGCTVDETQMMAKCSEAYQHPIF